MLLSVALGVFAVGSVHAQTPTSRPSTGPQARAQPAPQARPVNVVEPGELGIELDENGWPRMVEKPTRSPVLDPEADPVKTATEHPSRSSGPAAGPAPRSTREFGSGGRLDAPRSPSSMGHSAPRDPLAGPARVIGDPLAPDSPLFDVFRIVGSPDGARSIGAVEVAGSLVMRDVTGAHLGTRYFAHDFDLGVRARDRIRYDEQTDIATVYGRDGAAVFAERRLGDSVVPLPLREEASDELDLFGLLARVPWCFADREEFRMGPEHTVTRDGRTYRQLHFERERPAGVDRFYLLCVPSVGGLEPTELRFTLAGGDGLERRLRMTDYHPLVPVRRAAEVALSPIRLPWQRWLLDPDGRPLLEINFVRVTPHAIDDPQRWRAGSRR